MSQDICPECGTQLPDPKKQHCDVISLVFPDGSEVAVDFNKDNVWVKPTVKSEPHIITGERRKAIIEGLQTFKDEFKKRGMKPY